MSDLLHCLGKLFFTFRQVVLEDVITAEGQNQVLQDVNGSLSAKKEHMVLKKATLRSGSFDSSLHGLHFGSVLKLLVDHTRGCLIFSLLEQLARVDLHVTHFIDLVDFAVHWHFSHWVGQSKVGEELEVDELEETHVELSESAHHFVVDVEG